MASDPILPASAAIDNSDQRHAVPAARKVALSVVMPAYNEEDGIRAAVDEVRRSVFACVPEAELIVVNDGSLDATGQVLDQLKSLEPRLRVVHQTNAGHGPAVYRGMNAARGDYVLLIDSDRQIPLADFERHWNEAQRHDALIGVRYPRSDRAVRRLISRAVPVAVFVLFGIWIRDANIPYRIVRRQAWLDARRVIPANAVTPVLLFTVFLRWGNYDVCERIVPHLPRATGQESVHHGRLARFCWRAFSELVAFRWRLLFAMRQRRS